MGYKRATHILPQELLRQIQEYVDGEYIYIPRVSGNRRDWGADTSTRSELDARNAAIYAEYVAGARMEELAERHFLSLKSIQRIIRQKKSEE